MGKRWTHQQIEYLRQNFMRMSNGELCRQLGFSEISITTQMSRLGLCRSKFIKEKINKNNGNNGFSYLSKIQKKLMHKYTKAIDLFRKGKFQDARSEFEGIMTEGTKELAIYERARVYYNICCKMTS